MVALCIGGLLLLDSSIGGRTMQLLVVTINIFSVMFIMTLFARSYRLRFGAVLRNAGCGDGFYEPFEST